MVWISNFEARPSCTLLMIASSASRWATFSSREMALGALVFRMRFCEEGWLVAFGFPLEDFPKDALSEGFSIVTSLAFDRFFLILLFTGDVFFAIPVLLYLLGEWNS